ncbi:1,4-alpha-glucan branching protein GlgB [Polyangium jinanense]|uniref:1,4-alpha-glucan branching enzyme GlgB n=1 Tax=Polyangium jinanense TaxID=2829994 RepID=A0A9X4AT29_9BACT|nr:1,4-alpha-glucan branching protein GlgB [Polyangium jinanense]MDC3961665.1 1,4-alpha-glucan branching protein GlgB [Polyangium jinanense]MDC3983764.1 1,4-alpha-glucan branching protein GlgB [Polyangium jinanense]
MELGTAVRHDVTRLTEEDFYLFAEGTHTRLYDKLGAHPMVVDGAAGTCFGVWAPDAERVSVVGDFNGWDRDSHPLARRGGSGIWEGFVPGVGKGTVYKYFIASRFHGYVVEKADPFGFLHEIPPKTASIVWDLASLDKEPKKPRQKRTSPDKPVSIYEVHLGSFRRAVEDGNRPLTYRELAAELPEYAARMGFTHVELLPVMEHPFGGSWGYQITGYYAPTSRFGVPDDFRYLVDALHDAGLGVILDWVPSHFPSDEHGLGYFDGTYLFEHADPRKGYHPDWKSLIFNYGRNEVMSFLLSNAHFWLDRYRADSLRVDAVASMLYLDYSRKHGEWIPNRYGGRENLEAIDFLRRLNESISRAFPDVQTIAEESTSWPMVSRPAYVGGLGFGYKWDMGWMNDTLKYMQSDPVYRKFVHNQLTFRMMYAFSESFVLPLSHDEVVHGKGSLLGKMPGDEWQKFANLRILFAYMWAQPGKKLLFMGGEIAQRREWNHESSLDWHLLDEGPYHAGMKRFVQAMNRLYRDYPALHELDTSPEGFQWIDCNDADNSVVVFYRRARSTDALVLVALNFTPMPRQRYRVGLPRGGRWKELVSSDALEFGGSGMGGGGDVVAENIEWHSRKTSVEITLPPLGAVFFVHEGLAVSERPLGAVHLGEDRARFRVWAPNADKVELVLQGKLERRIPLEPEASGYHQALVDGVAPGARYHYDLGGGKLRPDPASRLQPEGVHGPSEVVRSFSDHTPGWTGRPLDEYVIYELHVGTFTPEGTFDAAISRLSHLRELGITAVELMPVAAFPGERNWGYDGAYPFAVQASYGGPEGLRRFVDACHAEGIAVILDVVYNHLGPEGTYLADFGPYFASYYRTRWGDALNFDGPHSDEVRKFFIESALHFVTQMGIDALRLDAVNAIVDNSPLSFFEELGEAVHRRASELGRLVHLIAESDDNDPRLVTPSSQGGHGLDGLWNDDVHYALLALLTNERIGYLQDFGLVEQLAKTFRENFAFAGEYSKYRQRRRGRPAASVDPRRLVTFVQNHDQVGNRPRGERLSARVSFDKQKLAAAVVLLSPFLPLLFMGEEYGEIAPFPYFTSHGDPTLVENVRKGRAAEMAKLGYSEKPFDPQDEATFRRAKLDFKLRTTGDHGRLLAWYKELIRARRELFAFAAEGGRQAVAFEDERLLYVRRWNRDSEVFVIYHFGDHPVTVTLPVPSGTFRRSLASSEARFGGKGDVSAPEEITSTGLVRVTLGPSEAALYVRAR